MSRPRTATALLDARGAFKNHPERKRVDPKVTDPFPAEAPSDLDPLEVRWWHKLVEQIPAGILTGADQAAMHLLAVLWSEFKQDTKAFPSAKLGQMRAMMGEFGMTPAARAKLAAKPDGDDGDF